MFEEKQELHFEVFDYDANGSHDSLGECFATLGSIMGARNSSVIYDLTHKDKRVLKSKIVLTADSFRECNDLVYMEWNGIKLANTDGIFDKSDPFLRFLRLRPDNTYIMVQETEKVMDNLNPIWKGINLEV